MTFIPPPADPPPDELNEFDPSQNPNPNDSGYTVTRSASQIVSDRIKIGQEIVRGLVCLLLLVIVAGIIGYAAQQSGSPHWENTKDWLQIVLPTMTGFLGTALGFYFLTVIIGAKC